MGVGKHVVVVLLLVGAVRAVRVTAGRVLEFGFRQNECGGAIFTDEEADSLVGALTRTTSETSCPSVGVLAQADRRVTFTVPPMYDIQASLPIGDKLLPRLNTTAEGIATAFSMELWLRPSTDTSRKGTRTQLLAVGHQDDSRPKYAPPLTLAQEDNRLVMEVADAEAAAQGIRHKCEVALAPLNWRSSRLMHVVAVAGGDEPCRIAVRWMDAATGATAGGSSNYSTCSNAVDAVQTAVCTATGGTFTLTQDGKTTDAILFDATADDVLVELKKAAIVPAAGTVSFSAGTAACDGTGSNTMTITFVGTASPKTTATANVGSLVGGTIVLAQPTAGVAAGGLTCDAALTLDPPFVVGVRNLTQYVNKKLSLFASSTGNPTSSPPWGQLYLMAMYDRPLSEAEVAQNFEAFWPSVASFVVPEDGVWAAADATALPAARDLVLLNLTASDLRASKNALFDVACAPTTSVVVATLPTRGALFSAAGTRIDTTGVALAGPPYAVRYRPLTNAFGAAAAASASFTVRANAACGGDSTITKSFEVVPVNDAPVAAAAARQEDATAGVRANIELATGATDLEGDAIVSVVAELVTPSPVNDVNVTFQVVGTQLEADFEATPGLANHQGKTVLTKVVFRFWLIDALGGKSAAPATLTVRVLNALRAIEGVNAVPEFVEGITNVHAGSLPASHLVQLTGRDTVVPARQLTFHVDRSVLPSRGKLYQLQSVAPDGALLYDTATEITPTPTNQFAEVSTVACVPLAQTCIASLVYVPHVYDFNDPPRKTGSGKDDRVKDVYFDPPVCNSELGATTNAADACVDDPRTTASRLPAPTCGLDCGLSFHVQTNDGARSEGVAHALTVRNVPNEPAVSLSAAYLQRSDIVALKLEHRVLGSFDGEGAEWTDRDLDACEWRAEVKTGPGGFFACDAENTTSALRHADFQRNGTLGDCVQESQHVVFFARPSVMRAVLSSIRYYATMPGTILMSVGITNTMCNATQQADGACDGVALALTLSAERDPQDLAESVGNEKATCRPWSCHMELWGLSREFTMLTFCVIFAVIYLSAHDFCARKRIEVKHAGIRKACGCGCCQRVGKGGKKAVAARRRKTLAPLPREPHHGAGTSSDDEDEEVTAEGQRPYTPWVKMQDHEGRSLYYNTETKVSLWKLPPGALWVWGGKDEYSVLDRTSSASQNPLQAGGCGGSSPWEARSDPQGRVFYFNTETKKSSWTMSTSSAADFYSGLPTTADGGEEPGLNGSGDAGSKPTGTI